MGIGFIVMYIASKLVIEKSLVWMGWLIVTCFFHFTGKLTLSPAGLKATLGNLVAGLSARNYNPEDISPMPNLFLSVVLFGIDFGILFLVLSGLLKKWMGNVH